MRLRALNLLFHRTLVIYVAGIVIPATALLWLGIQSFERQRQALTTLQAEKVAAEVDARTRHAAASAVETGSRLPIVRHRFILEHGLVTEPPLQSPPPEDTPAAFVSAETEELVDNRPAAALESYRRLLHSDSTGLALARIARCLAKLGRTTEARTAWRQLATDYPDRLDLSHRPYGIVGAIEAGDTERLYERIESGRWNLPADQAEYFLSRLHPGRSSPYLEKFAFARELSEQFRHEGRLDPDETYKYSFGGYTVFYRVSSPGRIEGIAIDSAWVAGLASEVRRELGFDSLGSSASLYAGAFGAVIAMLSGGIFLLLRDVSREARTNQMRSEFVSGVSHDLKTPVTVIRLYAETLLGGARLDDEQRRDFYRVIHRESGRLASLIDRVIAFSRLERDVESYRLQTADPVPTIDRIVDEYREYLDRSGFRVERQVPRSLPAIQFDEHALSQAVVNLLENAVKYSGNAKDLTVRALAEGSEVFVEVEDRGLGIDTSDQSRIFERYYRAQNGSAKGGYGLGLYLVRRIMDAHGGRAEVDSQPGRGSRFRLVFPVVKA